MKLTHKLCGAALLSAVGVALAVPNTTKAVESTLDGTGHIKFTLTEDQPIITDPSSTETITNLTVQKPGEFGIKAVTPLEFDTHSVLTAQTKREYNALPFKANPESAPDATDGAKQFDVQNFVAYRDIRATDDHSYKLSASLTQGFKDATNTKAPFLKGAYLTYSNVEVTSLDTANIENIAKGVKPTGELKPGADQLNGPTVDFIVNDIKKGTPDELPENTGAGNLELNFGRHTLDTHGNSVKLTIPKETSVGVGDYNAVITWTLSDTI